MTKIDKCYAKIFKKIFFCILHKENNLSLFKITTKSSWFSKKACYNILDFFSKLYIQQVCFMSINFRAEINALQQTIDIYSVCN